jgi:hypothetical protein
MHGRHSKSLKKIVYHEHRKWLPTEDTMRNAGGTHWLSSEHNPRPIGPSPQEWERRWDKVTKKELTKKSLHQQMECIVPITILEGELSFF